MESRFLTKKYDIPEGMPKADPVTGFIENPYDYTEEDIAQMISISKVDSFESGKTYSISSAKELKRFADIVNNGNTGQGSTFVLTEDIDLSEYSSGEGWVPIGDYATDTNNQFKGTFNGNGHIISNLTINRPTASYQGLFGYCKGSKVLNLGVTDVNILALTHIGIVAASAGTESIVDNCYVTGKISGSNYIGGLFAFSGGVVKNCYTNCEIKGSWSVGGLGGENQGDIYNCYSLSNVNASHSAGGLIGGQRTVTNREDIISNCHFRGTVSGEGNIGSFLGVVTNTNDGTVFGTITIENCTVIQSEIDILNLSSIDNSYYETLLSSIEVLNKHNISTNLQVGTKSDKNSQININTNFEYSLGKIVRNGIHTDEALNLITDFLNTMSDKQTQLGAVQNRLESAMDEIITQHDNLISARSTLRDADMAELSSAYIQQQILQEASATLMATANQSPSIALQLI